MSSTSATPTVPLRAAHLGPERRRPLILDAAFQAFVEAGYDGVSMESIARRAGVSKPVVYACFDSKEDLFGALLEREEGRILRQIAAALPDSPGADVEHTLAEALTGFLRAVAESPDAYRVVFLGEGNAISRRVQRGRQAQVDVIATLVAAWMEQRDATISPVRDERERRTTARLLAYALVGAAESAARALLAEPALCEPESMARVLATLITRGQSAL
jgi:AcrR family transcriptional regulator